MDIDEASDVCRSVIETVEEAVVANRRFLETILLGVLARGHVLLEDVPGTGKTLTARTVAVALGLSFSRVQFTPDLLPTDVTGTHVYNERTHEFEFKEGPVFANVVLGDEINRAPPKTQSALLEAMEEQQVTTDGTTRKLPDPFFVLATQNPIEHEGTFRLPAAQIDRFAVKTSIGYPDAAGEVELLRRRAGRTTRSPDIDPVLTTEDVLALQEAPEQVTVDDDILEYMASLTRATRDDGRVSVGVSPRGTQRLFEISRAQAVIDGRDYVTPDHVTAVAQPVLAHRLVLTPDARIDNVQPATIITDVLDRIAVPTVDQ